MGSSIREEDALELTHKPLILVFNQGPSLKVNLSCLLLTYGQKNHALQLLASPEPSQALH